LKYTDRRTELREAEFLLLFRLDFQGNEDIREQIDDFFEGEDEFSEEEQKQIAEKVMHVAVRIDEIDAALNEISVGWKTGRMTKVDLTALRLAYYEICFDENIPNGAAINEAVELAKSYGTDSSGSFVNGILSKVVRGISESAE